MCYATRSFASLGGFTYTCVDAHKTFVEMCPHSQCKTPFHVCMCNRTQKMQSVGQNYKLVVKTDYKTPNMAGD